MKNEFVPYELAVKLKALGFDEVCFGCFNHLDKSEIWTKRTYMNGLTENITAPLFQQAFRWFREKYMLVGVPTHQSYDIWNTITGECFIEIYPLNSYEEAELACLIKLLEIVE
jgi:hypothetical protein